MKRALLALAAALPLMAMGAASAAYAAPVHHPAAHSAAKKRPALTDYGWCDLESPVVCWYTAQAAGSTAYGHAVADQTNETNSVAAIYPCTKGGEPNGYVQYDGINGDTEDCPFSDTTLDHTYVGDEIVVLQNFSGLCFRAKDDASVVIGNSSCTDSSGDDWINVPDGSDVSWLNVSTADAGDNAWMCSGTVNDPLVVSGGRSADGGVLNAWIGTAL